MCEKVPSGPRYATRTRFSSDRQALKISWNTERIDSVGNGPRVGGRQPLGDLPLARRDVERAPADRRLEIGDLERPGAARWLSSARISSSAASISLRISASSVRAFGRLTLLVLGHGRGSLLHSSRREAGDAARRDARRRRWSWSRATAGLRAGGRRSRPRCRRRSTTGTRVAPRAGARWPAGWRPAALAGAAAGPRRARGRRCRAPTSGSTARRS